MSKIKNRISLDNWESGDWPYEIRDCLKFELVDDKSVEIEVDMDAFDKVAKKIAKEAIETFLTDDSSFMIFLNPKGLLFKPIEEKATISKEFLLPFDQLWANERGDDGKKNIETWRNWLNEQEKELKEG